MAETEAFKLDIDGHPVHGTICWPDDSAGVSKGKASGFPAVVLCRNLADHNPTIDQLWDAFIDRAAGMGLAVVSFEPRCAHLILDDFDAYSLTDYWRDAEAVVRHVREHERIGREPIAAIGYRLGALAAMRLCAAHPTIALVALVSPMLDDRNVSGAAQVKNNGKTSPAHLPSAMLEALRGYDAIKPVQGWTGDLLLLHGAADETAPAEQSVEYDRALSQHGVCARLELIARADHTFSEPEMREACLDRLARSCAATIEDRRNSRKRK